MHIACCSMQLAARLANGHMVSTWLSGLVPAALTDMAALICLAGLLRVLCLLPSLCCAAYVFPCWAIAVQLIAAQSCDEVA